MADELIDIFTKTGEPSGEVKLKSEAHKTGLYHASVHIWFYTKDRKILFQKRADDKDTFPGLWDVSVAGHIGTGEKPIDSAIREIEEEIGLLIPKEDLEFIGIYLAEKIPKLGLFDNEFHHIYLVKLRNSLDQLTLQKEEVSDIKLISINEITEVLQHPKKAQNYVPHDQKYFQLVFKEIINRLT